MLLFLALFGVVLLVLAVFDRKQASPDEATTPFDPARPMLLGAALILVSVIAGRIVPINGHGISLLLIYPIGLAFVIGLFSLLWGASKWISRPR